MFTAVQQVFSARSPWKDYGNSCQHRMAGWSDKRASALGLVALALPTEEFFQASHRLPT